MADQASEAAVQAQEPRGGTRQMVEVEAFDPSDVRPWRFHNRVRSGLDEPSLAALAASIRRDGQQQLGLARRLPPGDTHAVEVIFGVRRLEACRRADVPWRAEVRDASFSDAQCAALMHGENEWTTGVSALENAAQWKAMLDEGVFENQSALATAFGCHRGTVSRAVKTVTVVLGEAWLEPLVRPVMHEFTGRLADRLADGCVEENRGPRARGRARLLRPGELSARALCERLLADEDETGRETVFVRRKGRAGGGVVAAKIERDTEGGWSVRVRPHEQSPAELAELAEQVESVLASVTSDAAGVRLGRRLVALLTADDAKASERSWLEGCVWASARASGLDWDRFRCAVVTEALRTQTGGWERAVVRAVGGVDASPAGP